MYSLLDTKTNLRVDQNFVHQITNFKKYGKEDEKLIKELIIYMTLHSQKNLFGDVDLDPMHFCKEMKVHRPDIFSKHPDPIYFKLRPEKTPEEHIALQNKNGNMSASRVWDTRFENALLILQHEKFYFSNDNEKDDVTVIELNNFTYIKSLKIRFEKLKKTKKIIYTYQPTKEFEKNIYKLFLSINLNNYIKLRKSSLEDLYLKLLYRIKNENAKNNNKIYYNIEELALLMNISINTLHDKGGFSNLKSNINRKLNKYFFKKIEGFKTSNFEVDFPTLKFDWEKGIVNKKATKYASVGVFSWDIVPEKQVKENNNKIYKDIFYTKLLQNLSINYRENYDNFQLDEHKLMINFLNWLFSNRDYSIKTSKYTSIFSDVKGNKIDTKIESINFGSNLIKIGKMREDYNFISYKQGVFLIKDAKKNKSFEYKELKNMLYHLLSNMNYFEQLYLDKKHL